jgi:hypothetical protein
MYRKVMHRTFLIGDLFVRFGLDTNVLVDLILHPNAKEYFKDKGYSFPDKFLCTLPQCVGECKGVLINKYGLVQGEVDAKIDALLDEFMIEKLPRLVIESDISVVQEIGMKYGLNDEDVPIIYGFWKFKVNIVVVRDFAFEKTCSDLNITAIRWPAFK